MSLADLLKVAFFTPGLNGRWGLPLLFWGPPGVGKSRRIEKVAQDLGLHCTAIIASVREPSDFGGLPIPTKVGHTTLIEYAAPAWIVNLLVDHNAQAVVFLDEISTAPPAVQAALLRFILDGALGDYQIPKEVRFVAAANETEDAAGGWDLSPPLANRLGHIEWECPTASEWADWLVDDSAPTETITDPLILQNEVEEKWTEHFAQAKGLVASFIRTRQHLLFKLPKEGNTARSKAWPSPRTWELATRAMAGCAVHHCGSNTEHALTAAYIGLGTALELCTFKAQMDLPNPSHLLDGKITWEHDPVRLDRTAAVFEACAALLGNRRLVNRQERAQRLWTLLESVLDDAADLTVNAARSLVKNKLYHCDEAIPVLVALQPMLDAAGIHFYL
jgi:hypothetical protein